MIRSIGSGLGVLLLSALGSSVFAQDTSHVAAGNYIYIAYAGGIVAIIFAAILAVGLLKKSEGNENTIRIASAIREGADAFLNRQYKWITVFVIVVAAALSYLYGTDKNLKFGWYAPVSFITGAFVSALAGFIGMKIATRANARTAWAARDSLNTGLRVAFSSGSIMGMTVVGLGLLLVAIWYNILFATGMGMVAASNMTEAQLWNELGNVLFTFGMGASSVALFARIGGGIYTK
ncbi:MAG: sodium/proton-translocating pyrophosphatase, partial [Leptospiraceae bacterium]|nr:sodium/proton-translocating pyrophosphatase [Leptospiraceae bacterium]